MDPLPSPPPALCAVQIPGQLELVLCGPRFGQSSSHAVVVVVLAALRHIKCLPQQLQDYTACSVCSSESGMHAAYGACEHCLQCRSHTNRSQELCGTCPKVGAACGTGQLLWPLHVAQLAVWSDCQVASSGYSRVCIRPTGAAARLGLLPLSKRNKKHQMMEVNTILNRFPVCT